MSKSDEAIEVASEALLRLISADCASATLVELSNAGAFSAVGYLLKANSQHPPETNGLSYPSQGNLPPEITTSLLSLVDIALDPLLTLLAKRKPYDREAATMAVRDLTTAEINRPKIATAGAVQPLALAA